MSRRTPTGIELGPVLYAAHGVDVLVPVGETTEWDLPVACVLETGTAIGFPHPTVVAPHVYHARRWLVAPRTEPVLTHPADLYGAYVSVGRDVLAEVS